MPRIAYALAALALLPAPASAQESQAPPCGPLVAMAASLHRQFGETIQFAGSNASGAATTAYANPETGTWTMLVTLPGGPACIVASGDGWTRDPRTWADWFAGMLRLWGAR